MPGCCAPLLGRAIDFLQPKSTIVVTGAARGGTSMVALVLRGLGVSMGESLANNHEDLDFYSALNIHDLSPRTWAPLVAARNERFARWGFKSPLLLENNTLSRILPLLRNPIVVVVFRNPVAAAESQMRRDNVDLVTALLRWERLFSYLRDFLTLAICPVLMVNYDASVDRPGQFVREFAHCLGFPAEEPDELAASLISTEGGGYRMLPGTNWTAEFIDEQPRAFTVVPLTAHPGPATLVEHGTACYVGNVFMGEDHLIKLEPPADKPFGDEVKLLLTYPLGLHNDLTEGGHNLYISFGAPFSLGISKFISRADNGRILKISGSTPVCSLALGIADDQEFGMLKDLPVCHF